MNTFLVNNELKICSLAVKIDIMLKVKVSTVLKHNSFKIYYQNKEFNTKKTDIKIEN
jgi:hypothetical protein